MDSANPPSVVYSVEIARKGQPLGITIASAGGVLDPIVISNFAPGGLAERFGGTLVLGGILLQNRGTPRGRPDSGGQRGVAGGEEGVPSDSDPAELP